MEENVKLGKRRLTVTHEQSRNHQGVLGAAYGHLLACQPGQQAFEDSVQTRGERSGDLALLQEATS